MNDDATLEARLRRMWESMDPVPPDLAERVVFSLQLDDLEVELLRREQIELVGTRGEETARTVTFDSDHLTVMITLSGPPAGPRRLDGWISPPAALRIEARRGAGSVPTVADDDGRFSFSELVPGLVQLVLHPTKGASVELARPVVTPAIQI